MWNPFSKNSKSTKDSKNNKEAATQRFLRIAEIRDNTLVLKNGGIRAVLSCSSINFNLKSEQEQNSIIYGYQQFLNTLDTPVQIVMRSKKLDLDKYIDKLQGIAEKQKNTLLQRQTYDYADYIRRLIEVADIMQKDFYVVVPQDPYRSKDKNFFQKFWERMHPNDSVSEILRRHKEFDELKKKLQQNVGVVVSGLENCGLKIKQLTTKELIELFYQSYNPLTARQQKVPEVEKTQVSSDVSLGR